MKTEVDTVIISDVHLGSSKSRAGLLTKILKNEFSFQRLICLGDMFNDLIAFKYTPEQYKFLKFIFKLKRKKAQK